MMREEGQVGGFKGSIIVLVRLGIGYRSPSYTRTGPLKIVQLAPCPHTLVEG